MRFPLHLACHLLALTLALYSCKGTKKFAKAVEVNTESGYEEFIKDNPKSPYVDDAKKHLESLREQRDWTSVRESSNTYELRKYLSDHPGGANNPKARDRIEHLELEQEWERVKTINDERSYTEFVKDHPDSRHTNEAWQKIEELKEEQAWDKARENGNSSDLKNFIRDYPNSERVDRAKELIAELDIVKPAWTEAQRKNTPDSYKKFVLQFPNHENSTTARKKLKEFEDSAWESAKRSKNPQKLDGFKKAHPDSPHNEEIEKLKIDWEVDKIFSEEHGKLLPPQKVDSRNTSANQITIKNNTDYNLTIRYSGSTSRKIIISKGASQSMELPNGRYRVAASVSALGVYPYAGEEDLQGGAWESVFYIVTK